MIVFIDDEPHFIRAYVQAFEYSQFQVIVIATVDAAWQYIDDHLSEIDALVMDVMMPPGALFDLRSTKDGLRTGLLLVEQMRQKDERIPIIILTNANKKDFETIPHRNCQIYEKKEISPWDLVNKLSDMKRRAKFDD